MPLKGRQRTKHQKAHTAEMQKQRWLPKSQLEVTKVKTIPMNDTRFAYILIYRRDDH